MALDQYGGYTSLPVSGGGTGHFRVAKLGARWVFVTPLGNAFWMKGVFFVNLVTTFMDFAGKYGSNMATFGIQATKRMNARGLNAVAEFSTTYAFPHRAGVYQMPAMILTSPTVRGLVNNGTLVPAGETFKDLIECVPATFSGSARLFPDVFDPAFENYVTAYMPVILADAFWADLHESAWCIGIAADDVDDCFGFGPGPETPSPKLHPHPAWYAVAAAPTKASSTKHGQSYTDTTVYTKFALRTFLQGRYASIGALNTAWGSTYTTWDSAAGGWGVGTGWLDENGRHTTWLGSSTAGDLATATAGVIADLDDFLYDMAHQYFSVIATVTRTNAPNKLIWGPASLNGWGGLSRKQVLQAAGATVDVINAMVSTHTVADKMLEYYGDRPAVSWEGYSANADTELDEFVPDNPAADNIVYSFSHATQAARGTYFASRMAFMLSVPTVIGYKWWAWQDSWGEKRNWGFASLKDNLYDSVEARIATGTDAWGFPTGGEEGNYGNFLGPVATANNSVEAALIAEQAEGFVGSRHPTGAVVGAIL